MKTISCLCIVWISLNCVNPTTEFYDPPFTSRHVGRRKSTHPGKSRTVVETDTTKHSPTANQRSGLKLPLSGFPFTKAQVIQELQLAAAKRALVPPLRKQVHKMVSPALNVLQHPFAPLPDVSVTCSNTELVIRVKPIFYGFSVMADELTLGRTCRSNGVLTPYGDLLFTYALTDCDSERKVPPGYLIYKFVLHYVPQATHFPVHRSHRVNVDIECQFKRYHHVYQMAVRPTWQTPSRKMIRSRSGEFRIQLMNATWSTPARSNVYLLGQAVNVQVSALYLPHGAKLSVNQCYATTSTNSTTSPKYSIIDNFGCLLESQRIPEGFEFKSPRTDDTINFSIGAFQFISDLNTQIFLHCKLSVSAGGPSPTHKSCTYREEERRWTALTGEDSICECCDSRCVPSKAKRAMYEGFVSSGPVLISDQVSVAPPGPPAGPAYPSPSDDGQDGDDVIWLQAKVDGETDGSHRHDDIASVAMPTVQGHHDVPWQEDFEEEGSHEEEEWRSADSLSGAWQHEDEEEVLLGVRGGAERSQLSRVNEGLKFRGEMSRLREGTVMGSGDWSVERGGSVKREGLVEREGSGLGEGEGFRERQGSVSQMTSLLTIQDWRGVGLGEGAEILEEDSEFLEGGGLSEGEELPSLTQEEEEEEADSVGEEEEEHHFLRLSESAEEEFQDDSDGLLERGFVGGLDLPKEGPYDWLQR